MINKDTLKLFESNPKLLKNNLQIIACAGSGKTDFISHRVAYMIAQGISKSENIVAFTFTEKAAEELKLRIRNKIQALIGHQPDIGDLYVGTIHSFCYELLKEFVPGYRAYDVLDEGKRFAFINSLRREIELYRFGNWLECNERRKPYGTPRNNWIINTFIRCVDIVREEMSTPDELSDCDEFIEGFEIYEEELKYKKLLDFSSMMAIAVKKLEEDKDVLSEVNERYKYITVDEYQDINPIQERLIELLSNNGKNNVCVVGDDDQSIYQWRGSTVDNIISFKDRYKEVFTHRLPKNYRSCDRIIKMANKLIQNNNPNRLKKEMYSSSKKSDDGDIYKIKFYYQKDEVLFVVKKIQELIGTEWTDSNGKKRGLTYSDIAILFRSVKYGADPYIQALKTDGINYTVNNIGGLFDADEVDVIFDFFSYLADFEKIWFYDREEGYVPDENMIYNHANKIFILPSKKDFNQLLSDLKDSIKGRISLQGIFGEILVILGVYEEELHSEHNEVRLYNLGRLSQAITDYEATKTYCTKNDIKNFCWFIKNYAQYAYDEGIADDRTIAINAVKVMTLHSTKGLGFPVVFMPASIHKEPRKTEPGFLDPDTFDFSRYHGSIEDERRLFYVGMTRAKKFLYITSFYDPGYRKWKKKPCTFLEELNPRFYISEDIPDPTKRKKRKPKPSIEDIMFPTNYSEISDYLRCEYDYKLRYIFGFNPIIVQALGYGKQIHNILNILHKIAQKDREIPKEEIVEFVLSEQFYLRYAAKEQHETLMKSAYKSLIKYLKMWRNDFNLSVSSERNFEMEMENALISGTIDLLKRQNSDENILEVIDFKTGNETRMDEELNLQVQLYTIAAKEALDLDVQKAYVHFLDADKQDRISVLVTEKQLELAKKSIIDSVNGITSRRFRRKPKNKKICQTCDWRKFCPKKK